MNKLFLFLVLLPSAIWKALGADTAQLRAILKVKLMMDDRKPLSFGRAKTQKKPTRFSSTASFLLSALFGLVYVMPLMLEDRFMGLWMYFSIFLIMLSFLLITDFSAVLFDTRDKTILLPRPVNERTLLLSRMLHMFIYLFRIVFPMSLAGWIILGIAEGWKAVLWFPLMVLLLTFIALFLVNACYLLILSLTRPGKFKDVISYFQVIFSILFFACAYMLPRTASSPVFQVMKHEQYSWAPYTPSYWLAAAWSWIHPDTALKATSWISILAVAGPLILIWLTIRFLSPGFARKIGSIDASEPAPATKTIAQQKPASQLYLRLAKLLNRDPLSRAGFSIAWLQTGRSRSFRMRVYPSFAYVPVYFIYLVTQDKRPLSEVWAALPDTSRHILLLYLCSFICMQLLSMLVFSDQYKASWIYYSAPVEKPGTVMEGAFKGIWVKFFVPAFLIISCFILSVWGIKALPDILLAFVNITLFAVSVMRVSYRRLPFSSLEQMNEKSNRLLKTLFVMLLPASLGFAHYATIFATQESTWLWWLKYLFLTLSAILLWLVWDSYKNTSWDTLKKTEL